MNPLKVDALVLFVVLCVAVGAAIFSGTFGYWVLGVSAIVFSVTLALVMFFRQMEFSRKIARLERGMVDYETSVGERLEKMGAESVSHADIDTLKRELQLERVKNSLTEANQRFPADTPVIDGEEDEDKVVPFLRIVRDEEVRKPAGGGDKRKSRSFTKDALTLYLQPVISLQKRTTQAFDIVPGFLEDDGSFLPLSEKPDVLKRNVSPARRDLILLERSFDLLRSLDLEETDVKFNLLISGAVIESKKLFKEFMRLLNLHDRFGGTLFIGLEQSMFEELNKAARSRLVEANDAGFGLIISNCQTCSSALLAISDGQASGMSIDISTLTQNTPDSRENPEFELVSQAAQSGVPLIVSGVAMEAQVMELLDYSVELAIGPYFSEPKAPKTGLRGTEPAQA